MLSSKGVMKVYISNCIQEEVDAAGIVTAARDIFMKKSREAMQQSLPNAFVTNQAVEAEKVKRIQAQNRVLQLEAFMAQMGVEVPTTSMTTVA